MSGDSDVQLLQVFRVITVPSAVEPVRTSCSVGLGELGPVYRDHLATLVDKEDRIPPACMKVGEIVADH